MLSKLPRQRRALRSAIVFLSLGLGVALTAWLLPRGDFLGSAITDLAFYRPGTPFPIFAFTLVASIIVFVTTLSTSEQ